MNYVNYYNNNCHSQEPNGELGINMIHTDLDYEKSFNLWSFHFAIYTDNDGEERERGNCKLESFAIIIG